MHGLETIKAINANPAAYHAANEAAVAEAARTKPTRDAALAAQKLHGDRVAARQKANGPYVTTQEPRHLGQDGIECAIDQRETPFLRFWRKLNAKGEEQPYGKARIEYEGGITPESTLVFAGKGHDGLRAVWARPVNGARAYHGEYRTFGDDGETIWLKVVNGNGQPIVYTGPEAAIIAARVVRNEIVPAVRR